MKKLIKLSIITMLLCACILANKSLNASAKRIKQPTLNKTSIALKIGSTAKLKIKNSNKLKFKWSSSNKKIASVNSNGKVNAISDGYCYIFAKNAKKKIKLTCTIKVTLDETKVKSNISYVLQETFDNCYAAFFTNNNNFNVVLHVDVAYFDEYNFLLDTQTKYINVPANSTSCTYLLYPDDADYNSIKPSSVKVDYKVSKDDKNYAKDINMSYNYAPSGIGITCVNNSGVNISRVYYTVVSYNENNDILKTSTGFIDDIDAGQTKYDSAYYPHDDNYNTVTPSYTKIYVNVAR